MSPSAMPAASAVASWLARLGGERRVAPLDAIAGLDSQLVATGGARPRTPARIEGAPAPLAAAMAAAMQRSLGPMPARVALILRATVRDGVVAAADGTIVGESLINRDPDEALPSMRRGLFRRRLRDRPYVMMKQRFDANYGHWLVECLPRLALVADLHDLARCGVIVSAHHGEAMAAVYRDSLALFGIAPERIVAIGNEPVAVDELIYPTPMTRHPWDFAPRCVEVLERLAADHVQSTLTAAARGGRRLYVTRGGADRRRLLNEEAIVAVARAHGFAVVEPDSLTLREQMALFREAGVVAGPYGANMTSVLFARRRPVLFCVNTAWMQDDFFTTLIGLRGGAFFSLHGTPTREACMHADYRIDPRAFEAMLHEAMAARTILGD